MIIGKIVHIDEVNKARGLQFNCDACNEEMIVVESVLRKRVR
jgi:hypothetical protein